MLTFKNEKIQKILSCPICHSQMDVSYENSGTLYCSGAKKHCFDFSSAGYVNLALPGQSGGGDSKQAVRARSDFLNLDHYKPISDKLCQIIESSLEQNKDSVVVDAGCGEGYYTTAIAKTGFSVAGFDLSKFATEAAAKRAKREMLSNAFFGVASVFELPLDDESADVIVNVFAPCAEQEYSRILKTGGFLIAVCAGPEHLLGLKSVIYDDIHKNEHRADMPKQMKLLGSEHLKYNICVNGTENIKNLFAMTPYYWKTSQDDAKKLDNVEKLDTEIDIIFEIYQKI